MVLKWMTRMFVGKAAEAKAKSEAEAVAVKADAAQAGRSSVSAAGNAGSAATDDTKAVGQAAEIKAGNAIGTTEGVAASAADSAAGTTEAAGTATAEKAKKHHRPKIDHHESTKKIKEAFHIKDKHARPHET